MSSVRTIAVDPTNALGVFANAFRVVGDLSDPRKCLLEFLVYSKTEGEARVVGRVELDKGLLPKIRDEIADTL